MASDVHHTSTYDENGDRNTDKAQMQKSGNCRIKEYFKINDHSRTVGSVLDDTECNILLDTGVSKGFMLKDFYMSNK